MADRSELLSLDSASVSSAGWTEISFAARDAPSYKSVFSRRAASPRNRISSIMPETVLVTSLSGTDTELKTSKVERRSEESER